MHQVALALSIFLLCSFPANAQHNWVYENTGGHWYALTLTATDWHSAEAEAISVGGHLVTLETEHENDWVFNTFCPGPLDECWIGYTDEAVEGTWVWTSGSGSAWTNWETGEPNNQGDEDYAHLWQGHLGKWNDVDAGRLQPGVIELENSTFLTLRVDNLVAGMTATVTVSNATPDGKVGVAYSFSGAGPSTLSAGACGAVTVDLGYPISVLGIFNADSAGTMIHDQVVPAGISGASLWLQAFDLSSCSPTNYVALIVT